MGELARPAFIINQAIETLAPPGDKRLEPYHPVEFVFDHRRETEYNAGLLYSHFVNREEWKDGSKLLTSEISFGSRTNPRIQMADLWAPK